MMSVRQKRNKVIMMDLSKVIRKNPLCLMSVNTSLNMYDSRLVIPPGTLKGLIDTDIKKPHF